MSNKRQRVDRERGSILLIVAVFIATAIAGLAAISSGRVMHASKSQGVMESEARAFNSAYAQIHIAMNVVNNSAYDAENRNLVLQGAVAGLNGGTINKTTATTSVKGTVNGETSGYRSSSTTTTSTDEIGDWLDAEGDPDYGLIAATNVRVYRARDYISRLQRLNGEQVTAIDPGGLSDSYYVIEAAGRIDDTIRLVSALVRENEPFSSFVFFQNRATLGLSGSPRGLAHANEKIEFYFPDGNYVDSVSAVDGFGYLAGATLENTTLRDANPSAQRIDLGKVDFVELKGKADLFVGQDGFDAEIKLYSDGTVRIKEYTPPRFEIVTKSYTYMQKVGYYTEEYTVVEPVKVGTREEEYQEKVFDYYEYETYLKWVKVKVGEEEVTKTKTEQVKVGEEEVVKTKQEPVYELQWVTKYRNVKVWVPYDSGDAGGGTAVGGGGSGELGEYVWVKEPYQVQEYVQVGTKTVEYTVMEPIYETKTTTYTEMEPIYEWQQVEKTRKIAIYKTVTKTRTVDVYEDQEVTKTRTVNEYEETTVTWEEEVFIEPVYQGTTYFKVNEDNGGTIYIDGRVTRLYGDLNGRLTIVGNEKVRITGNIRYVDKNGNTAMSNGGDYTLPYERNSKYEGNSVLGVIARDDVILTSKMPTSSEVNGTLMSVNGRVGIDGFWADEAGELVEDSSKNRKQYLTQEQQDIERAYDKESSTKTRRFTKDSLRRIGGIISNNRIMETYIKARKDGTSQVAAGFKRGNMKFDINLLFNPPPNFVEVPRPVLTSFVPILMIRDNDDS